VMRWDRIIPFAACALLWVLFLLAVVLSNR
jgi:hypothetical protein